MILLTNNLINSPITSGIVAAIVSGIVSIVGTVATICFQNKNSNKALDVQRELANKQKKNKLIYETELSWADKLRETTAKLYGDWSHLQDLMNINLENKSVDELNSIHNEVFECIYKVQQDIILIELYFAPDMDGNDECLQSLVDILKIINKVKPGKSCPNLSDREITNFINKLRKYFDNQMKKMN